MEGIGKCKIKEEKYDFYEETLQPSQLEGFLEHKKAKVCMHDTMITMGGMMATIGMMSTMRDMVTMMKA